MASRTLWFTREKLLLLLLDPVQGIEFGAEVFDFFIDPPASHESCYESYRYKHIDIYQ